MRNIDPQERKIIRELIRNPRRSDNSIAKRTGIAAMTVNRKRKKLQAEGLLYYFTIFDTTKSGSNLFTVRKLYLIKFKIGITAEKFLQEIAKDMQFQEFNQQHIEASYLCEKDGHFALVMVVDALNDRTLLENFNGFIVPHLTQLLGADAIVSTDTVKLHEPLRYHHNYIPHVNMNNGVIRDEWKDEQIFVDELQEE